MHRVRSLHVADRAERHGIPLTSVARTLLDLAEVVDRRRLEEAVEKAERLRLFDLRAIEELCERSRGRRGLKALGSLLADFAPPPAELRSRLERRFFKLCRRAGLPDPAVNAWVEGHEVDMLWSRARLTVEVDGWDSHRTRAAFERDRMRDTALQLAGYRVLRVTYRQLRDRPEAVVKAVRSLLKSAQVRSRDATAATRLRGGSLESAADR